MATKKEFIADHKTVEDIRKYLKVDSLKYLSLDGLMRAIGESELGFCLACFDGKYPVQLPKNFKFDKNSMDTQKVVHNART